MKVFVALLLLAISAVAINAQATRAPPPKRTTARAPVPTRGQPVRQQAPGVRPSPRPSPSRAAPSARPLPGPTRQNNPQQPPPVPTRAPPAGNNPPMVPPIPTRAPEGGPAVPTRAPPIFPQNPEDPNWNVPTVGTHQPPMIIPTGPPNGGGRTTARPPRIGVNGIPNARCPAENFSRIPVHLSHESNCERFYKCDHGKAYEYQCPLGQHWNAMRNYCDFPANANCGGNNNNWGNVPNWNNNVPQFNPPQWNNNVPQFDNNLQRPSPPVPERIPEFQNPIQIPMRPQGK